MKRMSAVLQKFQNHRLKKYLIEDEVVMNWGILKKCILMLALGCGIYKLAKLGSVCPVTSTILAACPY